MGKKSKTKMKIEDYLCEKCLFLKPFELDEDQYVSGGCSNYDVVFPEEPHKYSCIHFIPIDYDTEKDITKWYLTHIINEMKARHFKVERLKLHFRLYFFHLSNLLKRRI